MSAEIDILSLLLIFFSVPCNVFDGNIIISSSSASILILGVLIIVLFLKILFLLTDGEVNS